MLSVTADCVNESVRDKITSSMLQLAMILLLQNFCDIINFIIILFSFKVVAYLTLAHKC